MAKASHSRQTNTQTPLPSRLGVLQRKCACGDRSSSAGSKCSKCTKGVKSGAISHQITSVLESPGRPLDSDARSFMEARFGHDFSRVRVHTDGRAAESARNLNSLAYTLGQHVVFNTGQYSPTTNRGRVLLAHELTHVLQQQDSSGQPQPRLAIGSSMDIAEQQADQTAEAVVFGIGEVPKRFVSSDQSIQRACGRTAIGTPSGCNPSSPTFVSGHPIFRFNKDCDDFASGEEARLVGSVRGLPSTATIEVHGFASVDGNATFNENLSCARALKAHTAITRPVAAGGAGIPSSRITTPVARHGPTPGRSADRRSVVIKSSAPTPVPPVSPPVTPLAVAFSPVRASTSPTGMPDRIPPRVDTTVGVGIVGFSSPMRSITLSLDGAGGGNGSATINGAATASLTGSSVVRLRGVNQTAVGNVGNLRLVADQGSTRLATSNAFSVSSVPQNHTISFACRIGPGCPSILSGTPHGIKVDHTWESDSGVVADLNQTDISERVEIDSQGGSMSSISLTTSGYLGVGTTSLRDEHSVGASSTGFLVLKQTQMFKDLRTGASDIPVTNSGYRIGHFILPIPGTGVFGLFQDFRLTTRKFGSTETALSVSSNAGSGSVVRSENL